ncbi:hypothetical protein [Parahaliea mediterranea]|uniref:hypothetical protein n=1 Tax=Parahaliea mediterranea TaxID=651086 RepID=UPI00130082F4|nr:hypothetical protein [Parahaliea mediterranea]
MKKRLCKHTSKPLPDHVYNDPKGRVGIYRYKRPDGKFKLVRGSHAEICRKAEHFNAIRQRTSAGSGTIQHWADRYIHWYELQNPIESEKSSWKNRCRLIRKFACDFNHLQLGEATVPRLTAWWDTLTYDQQHNRRAAFSSFFQWTMSQGAKELRSKTPSTRAIVLYG